MNFFFFVIRTYGGVLQKKESPHVVVVPTLMWVKALDMILDKLRVCGVDFSKVVAISGCAQVLLPLYGSPSRVFHSFKRRLENFTSFGSDLSFILFIYGKIRSFKILRFFFFGPQQHGTVYWNKGSGQQLKNLNPDKFLHEQLATSFSSSQSPIWMDSSTSEYCKNLEDSVGGPHVT